VSKFFIGFGFLLFDMTISLSKPGGAETGKTGASIMTLRYTCSSGVEICIAEASDAWNSERSAAGCCRNSELHVQTRHRNIFWSSIRPSA
jgi:hypothetical protein